MLIVLGQLLFSYYVSRFGDYSVIYGSLGIVIIMILWVWIVALITLFGGQVASHAQMMLTEGRTAEEVEERHLARSPTRSIREGVSSIEDTADQLREGVGKTWDGVKERMAGSNGEDRQSGDRSNAGDRPPNTRAPTGQNRRRRY
ncbi:MAG: YihY/virulence factor BrkB family protein [Anaerolineae bacterium]